MGQTLENGVYLPSEGERNCYAGLKTNWEILDQKVADVTALQQAVAGALHREIVESLPTTDIDPNTIYMILSGTSATENVYNEYMYVNNAWELIGTSATDLTNYYTKSEVDGKLLLKANDSDVVHKSGNETISGTKTFLDVPIPFKSSTAELGVTGGNTKVFFTDKNLLNLAGITFGNYGSSKLSYCRFSIYDKDSNNQEIENSIEFSYVNNNQLAYFRPNRSNFVNLGTINNRWAKVYAEEYYYGSNNVEFSNKFVTTDTNQTISGNKTFSSNVSIYNSNASGDARYLILKNQKVKRGSTTETGTQLITFHDKDGGTLVSYETNVSPTGNTQTYINVSNVDANSQRVVGGVKVIKTPSETWFIPDGNNNVSLGLNNYKWKDVQTTKVNALEPSSLSLPSGRSARVDISSYITNLGNGNDNSYTVPANGYIYLYFTSINGAICFSQTTGGLTNYAQTFVRYQGDGQLYVFFPVKKGDTFIVKIYTSSTAVVQNAYFIPCQGNV